MHFVDERYDHGPIFFRLPVLIRPDDTPETLAGRLNEKERAWQSFILNLVVKGFITLVEGKVQYANYNLEQLCLGRR